MPLVNSSSHSITLFIISVCYLYTDLQTTSSAVCQIPDVKLPFLRRRKFSNFMVTWQMYETGFGDSDAFWLGLQPLHYITNSQDFGLHVTLEDWVGNTFWATYCNFSVGPANDYYRLSVSGYDAASTAGDSLGYNDGMAFSTYNQDNDMYDSGACATTHLGAWWYANCTLANPTGLNHQGIHYGPSGVVWTTVFGDDYSFRFIEMYLRYSYCPCP